MIMLKRKKEKKELSFAELYKKWEEEHAEEIKQWEEKWEKEKEYVISVFGEDAYNEALENDKKLEGKMGDDLVEALCGDAMYVLFNKMKNGTATLEEFFGVWVANSMSLMDYPNWFQDDIEICKTIVTCFNIDKDYVFEHFGKTLYSSGPGSSAYTAALEARAHTATDREKNLEGLDEMCKQRREELQNKKKKVTAIHEAIDRFEGLSLIRKALIRLKGQEPTYDLLKDKEIEVIESLYRRKQKRH